MFEQLSIPVQKGEGPDGLWVRVRFGAEAVMIWGHGVMAGFCRLSNPKAKDQICYRGAAGELCWRSLDGVTAVEYSSFQFPEFIISGDSRAPTFAKKRCAPFRGRDLAQIIASRAAAIARAA